ncbi:MAG: hypothetical protein SGILL_004905, partial [Bacillariaceae sp.]
MRHGARTTLSKDVTNMLAEKGGATLTPLGQQQLYKLGEWLRAHYINYDNNGDTLSLEYYNPSLHRLESSNLDRTISSANALAMGLFPNKERATASINKNSSKNNQTQLPHLLLSTLLPTPPAIPVYTLQEENDVYLRAYRHCPTFHDNLQRLYETPEWKALEQNNDALMKKLANIFPEHAVEGRVPLFQVWNVYDPIHVAVTECSGGDDDDGRDATSNNSSNSANSCSALVALPSLATALSASDFAALELLTHQVEYLKFAQQDAGNLLGSNLLWNIIQRAADTKHEGTFFLYSAHAPTLLGFLATLQASEDFVSESRGQRFVDYGGALIVEVYEEINNMGVGVSLHLKLKYKSLEKPQPVAIPLKESIKGVTCGTDDTEEGRFCGLTQFTLWAVEHTLVSAEKWCQACGNVLSDVCLRSEYLLDDGSDSFPWVGGSGSSTGTVGSSGSSSDGSNGLVVAITFLAGVLIGIVLMIF